MFRYSYGQTNVDQDFLERVVDRSGTMKHPGRKTYHSPKSSTELKMYGTIQWRTEGGGFGVQPPPPKFLIFDEVEPDCKLSGKCLVVLLQHSNSYKSC